MALGESKTGGPDGWRPLPELDLRGGDALVFRYQLGTLYTMTLINRCKPRSGVESGLEVSELVETFGSPEEAVMWLEAKGRPKRVLALNFAPMYRVILGSGKVVPFPMTEKKPGWREV